MDEAGDAQEALIEAILKIKLELPDMTTKQIHSQIMKQDGWTEIGFGDVKKAASKAAKRAAQQLPQGPTTAAAPSSTEIAVAMRVRLHGLIDREDLNGFHATVMAMEGADGYVRVCTAHSQDSVSLPCKHLQPLDGEMAEESALFSTKDLAVLKMPGRGYGLRAQRAFAKGELILREAPIATSWDLAATMEKGSGGSDAMMAKLLEELQPFLDDETEPPPELMAKIMCRVAKLDFESLPTAQQKRWMGLCDSFTQGPTKTLNNVWRSNAYSKEEADGDGGCLYDLACRANHSCSPNMKHSHEGDSIVLVAREKIAKGDELCSSYLAECLDPKRSTSSRRKLLRASYNFDCACARCGAPASTAEGRARAAAAVTVAVS
jgi:hypothetical protein